MCYSYNFLHQLLCIICLKMHTKMYSLFCTLTMILIILQVSSNSFNLDTSNSPNDKDKSSQNQVEKNAIETKIEVLVNTFKININVLKITTKLDIVFLIDASSSVGKNNFKSELKFVKKILSDVTVDSSHTRVAIVTFSSPSNTVSKYKTSYQMKLLMMIPHEIPTHK